MSSFKLLGEAIIHTQYRLARGSPFHPKIISSYAINRTREAALAFQDCKRVRPRRDMVHGRHSEILAPYTPCTYQSGDQSTSCLLTH